ncbi:substrate-binding periplasmic protein [Aquipseudomonas ullengensis]|uniref:Amino acid ABC transporter substrate-binding protein n=1 Tax=Aquipseudomonas ullengensis TaxID=2759166 RepID=A0A7W4QCV6_9GAMM|nr:transporter substrate-binding domain-containing protein [Pseudomonas ullengensis]MBB2493893.1 amino acid ABC transporter substrate-binding protein [Pseudomonas ullengensis]
MRSTLLAGLLLLLCCTPLQAREWLVVGTSFPQVFERSDTGQFSGLAPELLRQMSAELGVSLRFELYPWARAQRMVEQGQADILIGPYRTPEREALFAFAAEPFYQDRIVFYVRNGKGPSWDGSFASLQPHRIAVIRGWTYGARFEAARPQMQLDTVESVPNGLRMLMAGRIELLATNHRNTQPHLAALQLENQITELQPQIDVQQGYFAFPRDAEHDELREEFDQVFRRFVARGELARLAGRLGVSVP